MARKLNVFIVDDNPQFLRCAREVIAALPDVDRIECATSAAEALVRIKKTRPDLVLTDLAMPKLNGFDLMRNLRAHSAQPRVVVMTLHDSPQHRAAALRMGAEECIAKHEFITIIPQVIESLAVADA